MTRKMPTFEMILFKKINALLPFLRMNLILSFEPN